MVVTCSSICPQEQAQKYKVFFRLQIEDQLPFEEYLSCSPEQMNKVTAGAQGRTKRVGFELCLESTHGKKKHVWL